VEFENYIKTEQHIHPCSFPTSKRFDHYCLETRAWFSTTFLFNIRRTDVNPYNSNITA